MFLFKLLLLIGRFLSYLGDSVLLVFQKIFRLSFKKIPEVSLFIGRLSLNLSHLIVKIFLKTLSDSLPRSRLRRPKLISLPFPNLSPLILRLRWFFLGFATAAVSAAYLITQSFLSSLPHPKLLVNADIPVSTKIYDRNGQLLFQIYAEENRELVKLEQLPQDLINATLAIEDRQFYSHPGINLVSTVRAARETFVEGHLQGGSTITQQLVRASLLSAEKTFSRKIREIILALWAETMYSKEQILEMYFNQIAYGGTAYGVKAAAKTYFGKDVSELTLAEAALLAGLPSAPSINSPLINPEIALVRQKQVMAAMVEEGYISKKQADEALKQKLQFSNQKSLIRAPHFVMFVKDWLVKKYGLRTVEQGGLEVTTTLDLGLQTLTQATVTQGVKNQQAYRVKNGAALVTHPKTGEILAMVGSIDFFNEEIDGFFNVTISPRSPGSSIKIVNYAAALESRQFTASSLLHDSPVVYKIPGSPPYAPQNYNGQFHGYVTLRNALGNSFNVPAVKVLNQIGLNTMLKMGERLGISSWSDRSRFGLSLTLGGGEVTLTELATAYGVLANLGNRVDLNPLLKVTDYRGRLLEDNQQQSITHSQQSVLSPGVAFILSDILADNEARSQTFGPSSPLVIPNHRLSVKTGTTEATRDNLTIGFSHTDPQYLVAVWIGNNDNSPMSSRLESGHSGAAPIWHEIMTELLKDKQDLEIKVPDSLVKKEICLKIPARLTNNHSEKLEDQEEPPTPQFINLRFKEYFLKGTEPENC